MKKTQKMIIKAYKALDNLGVKTRQELYYTLAIYALEFFEEELESYALGSESLYIDEEGRIDYEAFFHTVFLNQAYFYDYRGNLQGFYGKTYYVKKQGLLSFY